MAKITAVRGENVITIEKIDGKIRIDPDEDFLKNYLLAICNNSELMGGTYRPEDDTLLFYYNGLVENGFEVTVEGELETIPCEEGCIY